MKQLHRIISTCYDCPYFDEGFNNSDPEYNRCRKLIEPKYWMDKSTDGDIPDYCPLDDVVDESRLGDLTNEDIKRINETAKQIKNAKNVKDGRYG
jgi:hypothetical protein